MRLKSWSLGLAVALTVGAGAARAETWGWCEVSVGETGNYKKYVTPVFDMEADPKYVDKAFREASKLGDRSPDCSSDSSKAAAEAKQARYHAPARANGVPFVVWNINAPAAATAVKAKPKSSGPGALVVEETGGKAAREKHEAQVAAGQKADAAKASKAAAASAAQKAKDKAAADKAAAERKARGNKQ